MVKRNYTEVVHPVSNEKILLNNFWLRDHCKCNLCYNFETNQRSCNIITIPLTINPISINYIKDNLFIKWNDNHESDYNIKFLFDSQIKKLKNLSVDKFLWDQTKIPNMNFAKINFQDLLETDFYNKIILQSLVTYGFAFIENTPPTTQKTELAIKRLFEIQKTFFGEMWEFSDSKDHADSAYTNDYLAPHNDNTYFNDAAGLQIFHCIKHLGSGGENTLTDGFKILNDFKLKNPEGYQMLCNVNVPAEYIEKGQHHKYSAPIIRLNKITNEPEQIRLNIYDRAVFDCLPQEKMQEFYANLKEVVNISELAENQYKFKLKPGTIIIFDNWRLLHGRLKYTGHRIISGCYILRSEYMSKLRQASLIN